MQVAKFKFPAIPKVTRHLVLAFVLAGLLTSIQAFLPIDTLAWISHAKLGHNSPSNEIVFVNSDSTVLDQKDSSELIADAIRNIEAANASKTFLDIPAAKLANDQDVLAKMLADQRLEDFYLIGRFTERFGKETLDFPVKPEDLNDANFVVSSYGRWIFFDILWSASGWISNEGEEYNSFANALAGVPKGSQSYIHIDYRYSIDDFQKIGLTDVARGNFDPSLFAGKQVVLGYTGTGDRELIWLPEHGVGYQSKSFADIYAAESTMQGGFTYVWEGFIFGVFAVLMAIAISLKRKARRLAYGFVVFAFFGCIIAPIYIPFRTEMGGIGSLLLIFAIARLFNHWRGSIEMRSGESGLPTLKALVRKLEATKTAEKQALISAKLHGLSDAMAMLDDAGRLKYFESIAARLKIANKNLELFANSGEHIVWYERFEQRDILQSHLVALKAIFANPLEIDGKFFDVPVTFAADLSFGEAAAKRISNVVALADKTSLAETPILIGDEATAKDREWTVSLQSSIDAALKKGEIFPVFQPKICLDDGSICGYEALVRWNDKERGFISPAYFIEQCEQAGRMGKLTQFMLEQSIQQYQASAAYQYGGTLAVNISSTMFSDTSLPQMVADILDATGFPEERLVIEVTETARIHDPKTAKSVLNALASIGVGLSLDDFGTGTAGLETLYNYPFSEIKIDRAFIAGLNSDPKARLICSQVIALGNSLNMNVVAEGIEDLATMMALKQMGCPMMQGFYLGRPEVEPAMEPLVRLDLTGN